MHEAKSFEAVFGRLVAVTGAKTDSALARILRIKPQSVVAAKKRRQIPPGWLVAVAQEYGVTTDWLFFGTDSEKRKDQAHREVRSKQETPHELELLLAEQSERIRELEKQLADAKDEALKAYRLAVEALLTPVDTVQVPPPPPYDQPERDKPVDGSK